jgi:hypothetical protein
MGTEIVVKDMSPAEIVKVEDMLAAEARDVAAKERVSTPGIKAQGGRLTIAGQEVADNKLVSVILDHALVNAIYENDFNPDETEPPCCYAVGKDEEDMGPADGVKGYPELVFDQKSRSMRRTGAFIIHEGTCKTCPMNQFGSAEKGKGKACGNRRRLMVMAATDCTPEAIKQAEVYSLSLPPTSLQGWAVYVKGIRDNFNRPPFAVITEISTVPHKTWFKFTFKPVNMVDLSMIMAIKAKQTSVQDQLLQGWDLTPKSPEAEQAAGGGKF